MRSICGHATVSKRWPNVELNGLPLDTILAEQRPDRTVCSQARENGTSLREAATRIFSNASGSYSSNVNLAVENSSWSDEQQLQEMYMSRKSFAFNSDR